MCRYRPWHDRLPNRNSAASCWPRAHFGSAGAVGVVRGRSATEGLGGFAPPEGEAMLCWFCLTGQGISAANSGTEQDLGAVKDCAEAADPGGNSEVWEPGAFPSQLSRGERDRRLSPFCPSLPQCLGRPKALSTPNVCPGAPSLPSGSGEVGSRQRQRRGSAVLPLLPSLGSRGRPGVLPEGCGHRCPMAGAAKAAAPGGLARCIPAPGTRGPRTRRAGAAGDVVLC